MFNPMELNALLRTPAFLHQKEYWTEKLSGHIAKTGIPSDRPIQGPGIPGEPANVGISLPDSLCAELSRLGKASDLSIGIILLTALKSLVYRYTNNEDITVATPVYKKKISPETINNCLFVRDRVEARMSFKELMLQVRQSVLDAHKNQDYPFDKLIGDPDNSAGEQQDIDITTVLFVFKTIHADVKITKIPVKLSLVLERENGKIAGNIIFDPNSYTGDFIGRFFIHFRTLLENAAADLNEKISRVPFLSAVEREQLIYGFNNNRAEFSKEKTIHQLLEQNAETIPHHVAVGWGDRQLTYRELNKKANRSARVLRDKGIKGDRLVGILSERSPQMIVSILAVWKAGGAYIPLDTRYPFKRILDILDDSGTAVLITRREHVPPDFKGTGHTEILIPDGQEDQIGQKGADNLNLPIDMNGLSYVIYTSGSTGKPKGVMVEHIGMMNHIQAKINDLQVTARSIIAQNASHTFDISIWQFFTALIPGGRTVIYPNDLVLDPPQFISRVIADEITILEVVPSYLTIILDVIHSNFRPLQTLRYLVVTGETLKAELVKKWFEKYPRIKAVNAYGPTEASDDITHCVMDAPPGLGIIPIGRPIQNLHIYIVDNHMNLCPVGVKGEICVSGVGVGRGYLNDERKTGQVYREDPFVDKKGVRLFKIGDVGRWMPDGNIEFFGRKDYQVKIRGHRIELEEIESLLLKHNDVKETVVIARETETGSGDRVLCAYIVPVNGRGPSAGELKEFLSLTLPDYMIPTYLVHLEKLPLTPNGKVDRKALPDPVVKSEGGYTAPRNPVEEKLVEIWLEALQASTSIGIDDDFFDLGGHSLKAVMLTSIMHKELDIKVPLAEVFKRKTIRGLSEYIENTEITVYADMDPVEKREYYPLSSAQKRIYFLQLLDLDNTAYNMPFLFPLGKDIEKERIESALKKLVARHESLRTSFLNVNGEAVQRVQNDVEFEVEYSMDPVDHTGIMAGFIRPFDLSRAPLIRSGLIRLPDGRHVWMMDIHHIVSDGTSQDILKEDFTALYNGERLKPLRLQYKDFSQWQNRSFRDGEIKKQEDYWLGLYPGEIPRLSLPVDHRRPAMFNFEGGHHQFVLDREDAGKLKALGSRKGATLYMNILALLNTLFYKYTGQTDIVIGSGMAGRRHHDLQRIVGMFINTLPMRNYPEDNKTYETLLEETIAHSVDAFENQDVPFEELVTKLDLERDPSRNPLFDVLLLVQNFQQVGGGRIEKNPAGDLEEWNSPGETFTADEFQDFTAKFDMTFFVSEEEEDITIGIEYYSAVYQRETIARYARHFENTLKAVAADPRTRLKDIDILSPDEKQTLLYRFNDTDADYPGGKTVHRLFEEQVEKTPQRIAVVGRYADLEHTHITYRELNRSARRMARLLHARGMKTGAVVPIKTPRSIETVIGIFGILKAGGSYLPLDPHYPAERIEYILADSGARFLLTSQPLPGEEKGEEKKIRRWAGETIVIDTITDTVTDTRDTVGNGTGPGNPAYAVYTSGSTGKPKGVLVEHRSVVNILYDLVNRYPFSGTDTYLFKTPYTFDVSVSELFGWFWNGGRLAVLESGGERDPQAIIDVIRRMGVTHINFIPSMFNAFVEYMKERSVKPSAGLRYIFLAGEALSPATVNGFRELGASIALENIYGPTEAAIYSSAYPLSQWNGKDNVPIGKPVRNAKLYILDAHHNLQPLGVAGELCITGAGLARGYLNRPELTAERFFNLSYTTHKSYKTNILYKTGDLARWLPDGNIEFLGRLDSQVKIRGIRIELGEIENCLASHHGVKDAVVLVKDDVHGHKSIRAYITQKDTGVPLELESYLSRFLPGYMLPSFIVTIDAIPFTPNGKIDVKALPDPEIGPAAGEYVPPGNDIEQHLVDVWQEVLGIERIGITDNFFEIGGDSIKAIQVSARLRRYRLDLKMGDLFLYRIIKELAGHVRPLELEIDQGTVEGTYPLTPIQQWFFRNDFTDRHHFNQSVMLYNKDGFDPGRLKQVFTRLVEHHDALRSVFETDGSTGTVIPRNREIEAPLFDLEIIDLRDTDNNGNHIPVEDRIKPEADRIQGGIDLTAGPLVKLGLFKTPGGDHLSIVIHHLVVDGISWRILLEDFISGYRQSKEGSELEFPAKTDSFREWSRRLTEYAGAPNTGGKGVLAELDYWNARDISQIETLPVDNEIGPDMRKNEFGESVGMALSRQETEDLIKKTNWAYNTEINDILLAALGIAVKQWSGRQKIAVSLEGHGREPIIEGVDIGRTVGWFTTRYPVILDMERSEDLAFTVKNVKETLRRVPNKGIGYGILKYLTPGDRKKGYRFQSMPEISFNYLGQFGRETGVDGDTDSVVLSWLEPGANISPRLERPFALDINGMLIDGKFSLSFTYNKFEYKRARIEELTNRYKSALLAIVTHCAEQEEKELTPSDMGYSHMDIQDLEDLENDIGDFE